MNFKTKTMNKKRARQERALDRLKDQLKAGNKTQVKTGKKIPLTETDVKRIEKEIEKLSV